MNWVYVVGLFCLICVCSFVLTKAVVAPLRRLGLVDLPNQRSSHTTPTPRGGGLAVITSLIGALAVCGLLNLASPILSLKLALLLIFLAIVSWVDDIRNLGALVRFSSHILAVVLALYLDTVSGPFFNEFFNPTVEIIFIGLGWVWFINLFNFMDGIDGIASVEAITIGLGGAILNIFGDGDQITTIIGLFLSASALGFLPSNWSPAKIFMGDVGSIPLGFLCAWILLSLAAQGMGAASVILSLVFFSDATITLLKRLFRGEKVWQAHNQHFYQQAVQRGLSHSQITIGAICANILLIVTASWSTQGNEFIAIITGLMVVGILFIYYLKFPVSLFGKNLSS